MQAQKARWKQLCEQIAVEIDHEKFAHLVDEANKLLAQKEKRLTRDRKPEDWAAGKGALPRCLSASASR